MVRRKGAAIERAFAGEDVDTVEDISEVSQYSMAEAVASGDDRIIQLAELQAQVEKLTRLRNAHFDEQQQVKEKVESLRSNRRWRQGQLRQAEEAVAVIGSANTINPEVKIAGQLLEKPGEIGDAVLAAAADVPMNGSTLIGSVGGFGLRAEDNGQAITLRVALGQQAWAVNAAIDVRWKAADGQLFKGAGSDDTRERVLEAHAVTVGQRVRSALRQVLDDRADQERMLQDIQSDLSQYEPRLDAPFPQQKAMTDKIAAAATLQQELIATSKEAEAA